MNKRGVLARCSVAAAGAALLVGVAGAAIADEYGDEDVDVNVEITELDEPGVLAMSVDGSSATLAESGSTATVRQFTGQPADGDGDGHAHGGGDPGRGVLVRAGFVDGLHR